MFFKGSRYETVETHEITTEHGRVIRYKKVRFIPPAVPQQGHRVQESERLDHIAHRYYRDPERFWRICDANRGLWPDDLRADAGHLLVIPAVRG